MSVRVLVVDDEPLNVDLLQQELEDLGHETVVAFDGQQALDRVAEALPDIVLLDVMMPVLDGFEVCRRLKADPETQFIPVILMTALGDREDRIRGIEAGADDYLTKPVDERELKARMQTALRTKAALEAKVRRLHQTGEHLARFVPEVVRQRVAENPDAPELDKRDQDTSILFLDIVGYTALSEKMGPTELNGLTERYFSAFIDVLRDHGGELAETSGDGMMAFFLHEEPVEHARRAVAAGLEILGRTEALNAESERPVALHLGVNSGVAAVGSTRYRGERRERWVFTADGLVVNLAARLTSVARGGEILLGPETARRVVGTFDVTALGEMLLKNVEGPVMVHSVRR